MAKSDPETAVAPHTQFAEMTTALLGTGGPFAAQLRNLDPMAMFTQGMEFYRSMFEIAVGTSQIAPDKRDWRFEDETWTTNPVYKRLSQAYLAMTDAVEKMIPDDLSSENKARAQLAASIVTSTFAPTNTLLGNPAALTRTMESGGSNLARGFTAMVKDMAEGRGLPQQVDTSGFEVGRNMAVTPGKIVLRTELFELIEYAAATETVHEIPVLLVPPQIGRFYFTDLVPGRSFAEYVVNQGLRYFAISWRNPSPENREWRLEDYSKSVIAASDTIAAITGQAKLNLVGFCAGGITTAIVLGYLKARGDERANSLTLCVTLLDFKTDAALGAFRLPAMLSVAKAKSAMTGMLPGSDLHKLFSWLRPNDLVWNYWVNNYLMGDAPPAFDILAWNNDATNMAAGLHEDFLELFEANSLIQPGAYTTMGEPIDLTAITCDKFVVGAVTDHLTPWKACYQAQKHLGGETTFALSNGGHIAALVNPPGNAKAFNHVGPANATDADSWLETSTKLPGSWWESWTKWCRERSGERIAAPKAPGSKKFPPLCDAPGTYVRE